MKVMNDKFDELAKGMAQSVTRRGALKKFGVGLAGIALATLGLAHKANADPGNTGHVTCQCKKPNFGCDRYPYPLNVTCMSVCWSRCTGI